MSRGKSMSDLDISAQVVQMTDHPVDSGQRADLWKGELRTEGSNKVVALKLLRGRGSAQKKWTEEIYKRYIEHAQVWCQLYHRNVAPVFGLVTTLGVLPALVMPYYSNGSVMHRISCDPNTPRDTRLSWIVDAASGLQYLHNFQTPVIHGDIRGANIFIDDAGQACLADFGMPFILDAPFWSEFKAIGPCRWTAPEVMDPPDDEPVMKLLYSKSSDVYSLGMTMLEIITGKAPFAQKDHDLRVYTFVASGKRPDIPADLQEGVRTLIENCWAQDPSHRPSARDVCETLMSLTRLTLTTSSPSGIFDFFSGRPWWRS